MADRPYEMLRQRLGALPSPGGDWSVTHRSSPGYRVELQDGTPIAWGPEPPHRAPVAHFLVEARRSLPGLLRERDELREQRDRFEEVSLRQFGEIERLRAALRDVLDGLEDGSLPDWFRSRVEDALSAHGVTA